MTAAQAQIRVARDLCTPHPASVLRRKGRSDRLERGFLRQKRVKPGQGDLLEIQRVAASKRRERRERREMVGNARAWSYPGQGEEVSHVARVSSRSRRSGRLVL